jgi:beta-N-acetylhexosaminidase
MKGMRHAFFVVFVLAMDGPAAAADFRSFLITLPEVAGSGGAVYYGGALRRDPGLICRDAARDPSRLRLVDQEGGRVRRLRAIPGPPPAATAQALGQDRFAVLTARAARAMRAACVQINLAPVADANDATMFMARSRSYGATPEIAHRYAAAFARAMNQEGIVATWKHFSGHSGPIRNIPADHPARALFRNRNFEAAISYASAATIRTAAQAFRSRTPGMLMLSQAIYPALGDKPAVLDARVAAMARRLQPLSLIISDDVSELKLSDREILVLFRHADMVMVTGFDDVERIERVLQEHLARGRITATEVENKKLRLSRWKSNIALFQ